MSGVLTAAEMGRQFKAGRLDPRDVLEESLARIEALKAEPIFIATMADSARFEAAASLGRYRAGAALGPLDGVPVAWKDLFDIAGLATTSGSVLRRNAIAQDDADAVVKLRGAGVVSVGKTNMTEFAFSTLGLNPHFGTPANARDAKVRRAPGGSSSGSAVAVGHGIVPLAMGSDTGGSIRIPASLNGIVGFKPSHGRYDLRGVFPLAKSLDTIGPFARSVEDCILVDAILRGDEEPVAPRASLKGLRVVVPPESLANADAAIAAAFERSLSLLSAQGAVIERRTLPVFAALDAFQKQHGNLIVAEAYDVFGALAESADGAKMDRRVRERVLPGKGMSAEDRAAWRTGQDRLAAALAAELGADGVLATPSVVITPPPIAELDADDAFFGKTNIAMRQNSAAGNILKLPGISFPNGQDALGLPTGLLLSMSAGADKALLATAAAVERLLTR